MLIDTRQRYQTEDPGEAAYVAYWKALAPHALAWMDLSVQERRAWRTAARAATRIWAQDGHCTRDGARLSTSINAPRRGKAQPAWWPEDTP